MAGGQSSKPTEKCDEELKHNIATVASQNIDVSMMEPQAARIKLNTRNLNHACLLNNQSTDNNNEICDGTNRHTIILNKLNNKLLHSLRRDFDNILITPSLRGEQALITFDYKHIFGATLTLNCRTGFVSLPGAHSDYSGRIRKTIDVEITKYGVANSYAAKLSYKGHSFQSTFFPNNWQPNKVMSKIKEAYLNMSHYEYDAKKSTWAALGNTSENMPIQIIFAANKKGQPTGKVITAYPIV